MTKWKSIRRPAILFRKTGEFMRRISFIILLCFFCLTTQSLGQTVKVTSSKANLRSGPGMEYQVITKVTKAKSLDVVEKKGDWLKVRRKGGKEGWIHGKLVKATSPSTIRVSVDKENFLKTPGGQKIGEVLKDTQLKVIRTKGRWDNVRLEGWIWRGSTEDVQKMREEPQAEKPKWPRTKVKNHGGFVPGNVKLTESMGMVKVTGEMTNESGKDYFATGFIISLYDVKGRLLGTGDILIDDFPKGETKSFTTYVEEVSYQRIHRYRIQFDFEI